MTRDRVVVETANIILPSSLASCRNELQCTHDVGVVVWLEAHEWSDSSVDDWVYIVVVVEGNCDPLRSWPHVTRPT